jgi:Glycosyl transferases group 1
VGEILAGALIQDIHVGFFLITEADEGKVAAPEVDDRGANRVLRSAFEGFGLVIPEAMTKGMPVIASTHSIGPEIVANGEDGIRKTIWAQDILSKYGSAKEDVSESTISTRTEGDGRADPGA